MPAAARGAGAGGRRPARAEVAQGPGGRRSASRSSAPACRASSRRIRLKQAGVPFAIIEKNADVGGTWFENTYPGARVDVANAFYSYSFAQKIDWPKYFSPQGVLLDYFRSVRRASTASASTSASAPRSLAATFDDERAQLDAAAAHAGRPRGDDRSAGGDQRRRPAQPPEHAGDRRHARRSRGRRSTPRAGTTAST